MTPPRLWVRDHEFEDATPIDSVVTADTALRFAGYFGTTPQFWLNLQSAYDLRRAEIAAGRRIEREVIALTDAA